MTSVQSILLFRSAQIFLVCAQLAVSIITFSCGASSRHTQNTSSGGGDRHTPVAESSKTGVARPSVSPEKTDASDRIRQIDFANFTYPWYPSFLQPPQGRRKVTLRNGRFEIDQTERKITPVALSLGQVRYADLTGDSEEEAIVYIAGTVPPNSFLGNVLIYAIDNGGPKLLWQHETGDRGNGGLRSFRVEDGTFIIDEYSPEATLEESLCCPKQFMSSRFRWDGKRFGLVKSAVLANEYPDARFLGFRVGRD